MSENKDISSSSSLSADTNKIPLLPEDVRDILQNGMTEGFKHPMYGDGYLSLGSK